MIINHSLITIIRNHFLQQVRFREDSLGLRDIFTYLGNAQVSLAALLGQTKIGKIEYPNYTLFYIII